ncbi:SDR family NAD(P)-dependent oxidoreductase [Chondromyces apiculatus]|uniref:3-oxoacyl-[acyl-carrier protein] reductase n=1 Tax=Chondromyces apiculatus DSM 436 TaxID=1192034 RepID=A0A017SUW4_9BACT|nr:SDR family oxidoreductase [Chondromyces apiculatus]EYF00793.1 3-oxoacyl-[acyl-carrier protein] reductase [Chondromyces apiculatus DSM 436]
MFTVLAAGVASVAIARNVIARRRRLDLRGRVAVVTGGSRGLGLLMAEELGRLGARVALCGRDAEAVSRARVHLESLGVEVHAVACDLGVRAEAEAFVDGVVDALGRIDLVFNNAGAIGVAPVEELGVEGIEEAMRSNFWSATYVTFRALPHLKARGSAGRLVNISSIGGRIAVPHMVGYVASKFAVAGLSEALCAELAQSGIRVTTVFPGLMRTGSIYNATFGGDTEAEFAWFGVSASMPVISMNARRAAKQVVRAALDGETEVKLGVSARSASLLHGVAPGFLTRMIGIAGHFFPSAPGGNEKRGTENGGTAKGGTATSSPSGFKRGRDVRSSLPGSVAVRLSDEAARNNNEAPPAAAHGAGGSR